MKVLLVPDARQGQHVTACGELFGFAGLTGAEVAVAWFGEAAVAPAFDGELFLAGDGGPARYAPDLHKHQLLQVIDAVRPDVVAFMHTSWGWDLAPRLAASCRAAQVSDVIALPDSGDGYLVASCNGKLRRTVRPTTPMVMLTLQPGAFPAREPSGVPAVHRLAAPGRSSSVEWLGLQEPVDAEIDLGRAQVIVAAGRGIGGKEQVARVETLAGMLGGQVGASRPAVDAGWVAHGRQIGTTGQTVSPAIYIACGISGAVQHLAGMKGSGYIVAVNTDRDAPIGEIADLLVVADLNEFLPELIARL